MSSNSDNTSRSPERFVLERLPADLTLEVQAALTKVQICVPTPAYDIDYFWVQETLDHIKGKGCNTIEDALLLVQAAVSYYLCEKCTKSVVSLANLDFNEMVEADKIFSSPNYFTDFSRYDNDPPLKQMQQYLLAYRLLVTTYLLSEHDRPFGPRAKKLLEALPRILGWLDENLLAATNLEKKGTIEEPFCESVRRCTRVVKDAVCRTLPHSEFKPV